METLTQTTSHKEVSERLVDAFQASMDVEESFRELFRLYYRPLVVFFLRRGFTPEESEDFTQESFFRVYRGLRAFRREVSFEHWIFHVATNVYRSGLQRRSTAKRRAHVVSLDSHADGLGERLEARGGFQDVLGSMLDEELLGALRQAVAELPDQMRRCVFLRLAEELKYREIAEILQISIQTVKTHLARARTRLRDRLRGFLPSASFEYED